MSDTSSRFFSNQGITQSTRFIHTPGDFALNNLLYVQEAGVLKSLRPHTSSREGLESILFITIRDGEGFVRVSGNEYTVKSGDCILLNCMNKYEHESSESKPWELSWVHFYGKTAVNFSEPYYDAGLGILITKANSADIKSKDDLKGKTICAQLGTSGAMYAEKVENTQVTQFNSTAEAFLELEKGSCSAVVTDKPVIEYYLATTKNENLIMIPEQLTVEQYGIVTSKDRKDLTDMIASGLKKIRDNGTYDKIYQKWFGNAANQ